MPERKGAYPSFFVPIIEKNMDKNGQENFYFSEKALSEVKKYHSDRGK